MSKAELKFMADDQGAVRAAQRLREEIDLAAKAGVELGVKATRGAKETKSGLDGAADSARALIGQYGTMAGAIGLVVKALQEEVALRKQAAELQKGTTQTILPLVQLATDSRDLARMKDEVRRSRSEFGMSPDAAANLQFTLESLGIAHERRRFAGVSGIDDPARLAEGAQTMVEAMPGTGTPIQMANMLLAASQRSKTRLGQFAPAATIAAQEAGQIGSSPEELLGALSVVTKALKSADTAGTGIARLSALIFEKGYGGKGLLAGMKGIESDIQGMAPDEMTKYFGNIRATRAFLSIRGHQQEIEDTIGRVQAEKALGPDADYLSRMAVMKRTDPDIAALGRLKREQAREAIATEERWGTGEMAREQAIAASRARQTELGGPLGPFERFGINKAAGLMKWLGASGEFITGGTMAMEEVYGRANEMVSPGSRRRTPAPTTQPTTINNVHNGDIYHLGQQDVTAPPPAEVVYQ